MSGLEGARDHRALPPERRINAVRPGAQNWFAWGLIGVLSGVQLKVVGEIYAGEMFAVAALPLLVIARQLRVTNMWILYAGLAFSSAQLLSDFYNDTASQSAFKGILAPTLFCVTITVLLTLFERHAQRMYSVLTGVVLYQFVQVAFWPDAFQQSQPWKWGYGHATLLAGLILLSMRPSKRNVVPTVAVLLFAAVSVLNNARSLAGLPLIGVAAYTFWQSSRFIPFKRWLLSRAAPFKLVMVALPLLVLLNFGLGFLFTSDVMQKLLDPAAAQTYRQQAQSDVGLLLAGRSEWLVSFKAFLDAPFLGHGSWAEDTGGYLNDYSYLRLKYGIAEAMEPEAGVPLIPAHSFLFGALVWAGISGGLFWLFFGYRLVARYLQTARYLPVYFHVGIVMFLWDLLFSPFGAQSRWATALFVAALLAASHNPPRAFDPRQTLQKLCR